MLGLHSLQLVQLVYLHVSVAQCLAEVVDFGLHLLNLSSGIIGNQSGRSSAQKILLDVEQPRVTIDAPPAFVRNDRLTVTGLVTNDSEEELQSISITVNDGDIQDLGKSGAFRAEVTLQLGDNTIRVEAVDAVGSSGDATVAVQLDNEAPTTAPTWLTARINATGNAIRLPWEVDENATTYNTYRFDTEITEVGELQPIGTGIVEAEFIDDGIVPGITAYYAVTSVDAAGNEGSVVSNSPNVVLITSNGGVAAITDGTTVAFGRNALFTDPSLSASVTIKRLSDDALIDLPAAIVNSGRELTVTSQSGESVETFNQSVTVTLAYPETIKDTADSPQIFEFIGGEWTRLENQVVDPANNTVSAPTSQSGIYCLAEIQLNPWDVNGDLVVNIFDLVLVGSQFGQTPPANPATDVNSDSTVNIFDLVLVGGHFGEIMVQPLLHRQL